MNVLRAQLRHLLSGIACSRPLALRRSLRDSFLYATDLPAAADRETVAAFQAACRELGWTAEERDGWVELDRPLSEPPEGWEPGPADGEAGCCLSLLKRHRPATGCAAGQDAQRDATDSARKLLKAGEKGGKAWEEACVELHREWALRLRLGRPLPPLSFRFFEG